MSASRTIMLVAGIVLSATGCTKNGLGDAESSCSATVHSASLAAEVDQQVRLLDQALERCRSVGELTAEMDRYPGIIGYDVAAFVQVRCGRTTDTVVRAAPVCATVITPATTVPTGPVEVVFVGDTLDGRRIQIRPDADTVFVGDVPAVVQQTVDIAIESGCDGVIAQRDLWAGRVNDPAIGDEASVYARHAQNVADYIGCLSTPVTIPPAPPTTGG